jgi:HEAT repeat protein
MRSSKTATCDTKGDGVTADRVTAETARRHFDADATSWLVGEAIARLHSEDLEGQGGFKRAVELMARVGSTAAVGAILDVAPGDDVPLRWSLLYVLAETGDPEAARLFARAAMEPIHGERDRVGCESAYDGEVLVRTMAIEGLGRLAERDSGLLGLLYEVLKAQPERALRVEAVKAILAVAPDEAERLRETLPEDLHFALRLKQARAQTLAVEYEAGAVDTVRAMPSLDRSNPRPTTRNCCCG